MKDIERICVDVNPLQSTKMLVQTSDLSNAPWSFVRGAEFCKVDGAAMKAMMFLTQVSSNASFKWKAQGRKTVFNQMCPFSPFSPFLLLELTGKQFILSNLMLISLVSA